MSIRSGSIPFIGGVGSPALNPRHLITTSEAAEILGVSRRHFQRLAREGQFHAVARRRAAKGMPGKPPHLFNRTQVEARALLRRIEAGEVSL